MFRNLVIKRIVASAMLIVFAISITPTIVFHNWLAGHTDILKKCTHPKDGQVGKQTFNCHCDNIVAESPFTEAVTAIVTPAEQVFSLVKFDEQQSLTSSPTIFHALRGPPAV
ncbi:MAG: hypothetical protein ABIO79_07850 [Ferruginibacter sp.]